MEYEQVCRKLAEEISSGVVRTREQLDQRKAELSKEYHLPKLISNPDILSVSQDKRVVSLVQRKPTRTISGVAVIAVMTRPHPCPHGRCLYCPGGINTPQSYTGKEPAAMRAIQHAYDPYAQVQARLAQLRSIGHSTDKCELILMGGTFPSEDIDYQEYVVKGCFDAFNEKGSLCVEDALRINEHAENRVIGVTMETRPDWCKKEHIDRMLQLGTTRVELGVQTVYDSVYELVERGHTVDDVVMATEWLKDAGLKVGYHMMPGLPGSDFDKDIQAFRAVIEDARFKPDMLKVYPCQVLEDTTLYEWYTSGRYTPYSEEDMVEFLVEIKKMLPEYVRIMRIGRDIPSFLIKAGITKTNIGQIAERRLKEEGFSCKCIRCREVGRNMLRGIEPSPDDIRIVRTEYEASHGEEIFLQAKDTKNDLLIAFLRLRIPENSWKDEIGETAAVVRELRVYGPLVPLGESPEEEWQHRGFGEDLLREAERLSLTHEKDRLLILSGVGVKEYYAQLGYHRIGPYMGVDLDELG
ncbi:MAG: tRNA uridine(34) 5-carboxymethylaminomethyl modification radical SAM/GNAT enzyme Elp3 [Theionarchaea archaeon]|nr:tRNA uridine(34) 5-carboxymethylaminomethyl modification radical SAM/GNAT enzyme Elp3 [Theionarchaea archaeon]MBU7037263.1 tRNA uridine(34) 5-carboxymethylaminomethyl modification radical SAM/GNAT enzyme Elp3 [Theionarchaea archaeon]